MCIYTHTHIYIYIHTHTHTHIHINTYNHNCNIRSYTIFSSVGICASCEKVNLMGDEILGLAVAPQ